MAESTLFAVYQQSTATRAFAITGALLKWPSVNITVKQQRKSPARHCSSETVLDIFAPEDAGAPGGCREM